MKGLFINIAILNKDANYISVKNENMSVYPKRANYPPPLLGAHSNYPSRHPWQAGLQGDRWTLPWHTASVDLETVGFYTHHQVPLQGKKEETLRMYLRSQRRLFWKTERVWLHQVKTLKKGLGLAAER